MNWEEFKRLYLTDEEREEIEQQTRKFNEEVKKYPWKYLRKPKRHVFKKHEA